MVVIFMVFGGLPWSLDEPRRPNQAGSCSGAKADPRVRGSQRFPASRLQKRPVVLTVPTIVIHDTNPFSGGRIPREPATFHHPVDDLEPVDTLSSEYRQASRRLLTLLFQLDSVVTGGTGASAFKYECCALALGLPSMRGVSETALGERHGVGRAAVSKHVAAATNVFRHHLPAFGLKSHDAKLSFRMHNGRLPAEGRKCL
jgi:hypothetical protein